MYVPGVCCRIATGYTKLTGGAIAGGAVTSTHTLKINGVAIDVAGKTLIAGDSDGVLTRAINDQSDLTGVTASVVGGKLVLEAADGRNISISSTGGTTGLTAAGLTAKASTQTSGANATLASTAPAAVTLTEGQLIINGVDMAGTYGDGTTQGSAGTALQAAIRNISGYEDSSIAADGAITLLVNDGQDMNVAGSSTYNLTEGITNNAEHGVVNIYSDQKVTIAGTDPASFGFTAGGFTPTTGGTSLDKIGSVK